MSIFEISEIFFLGMVAGIALSGVVAVLVSRFLWYKSEEGK